MDMADINDQHRSGESIKENYVYHYDPYCGLEEGVYNALETYSNVHRGSGHYSMATTRLYDQARDIVLEYLGLKKRSYVVIFCTPARAIQLEKQLKTSDYMCLSSSDTGLSLGVKALAVRRKALPAGTPFQTGGGTARLVSPGWVVWARAPERHEAGTPMIINVIAFARALKILRKYGEDIFRSARKTNASVKEILYHDDLENYRGRDLINELRKNLIGKNIVPTSEGRVPFINLDNGASTQTFIPVWKAVCQAWRLPVHEHEKIIEETRIICSEVFDAPLSEYDLIFTSNTTESINLVAEDIRDRHDQVTEPVILNTLLEHNSNDLPWRMIPGASLVRLSIDSQGFIDLNQLKDCLRDYNSTKIHGGKRIKLVAISGASNVLGVYNDLEVISQTVHSYGALLLVDAAQMVAHCSIAMQKTGIDYLAFSAHKVYAPFGTGVLIARKGLRDIVSERSKAIKESGEENIGGIAALGKIMVLLNRAGMDIIKEDERFLTAKILTGLNRVPGLTVYGIKDPSSPEFKRKGGVIAFSMKSPMPNKVARILAERGGIGVRYGCHCAHMLVKHLYNISPSLEKFQGMMVRLIPGIQLPGMVRISIGIGNNEEEIDKLLYLIHEIATRSGNTGENNLSSADNSKSIGSKKKARFRMNDFIVAVMEKVYSLA
jgi:selenocysteine lyase/cysteine desulfurase